MSRSRPPSLATEDEKCTKRVLWCDRTDSRGCPIFTDPEMGGGEAAKGRVKRPFINPQLPHPKSKRTNKRKSRRDPPSPRAVYQELSLNCEGAIRRSADHEHRERHSVERRRFDLVENTFTKAKGSVIGALARSTCLIDNCQTMYGGGCPHGVPPPPIDSYFSRSSLMFLVKRFLPASPVTMRRAKYTPLADEPGVHRAVWLPASR